MDVTVKDVSDKGDITYELVMGDTSVADDPGGAAAGRRAYEGRFGRGQGDVRHGHGLQPWPQPKGWSSKCRLAPTPKPASSWIR